MPEEFIDGQGIACECSEKGCHCGPDEAILRTSKSVALCACCAVDCPHVHDDSYLKDHVDINAQTN